jgi:hypothetical protein
MGGNRGRLAAGLIHTKPKRDLNRDQEITSKTESVQSIDSLVRPEELEPPTPRSVDPPNIPETECEQEWHPATLPLWKQGIRPFGNVIGGDGGILAIVTQP